MSDKPDPGRVSDDDDWKGLKFVFSLLLLGFYAGAILIGLFVVAYALTGWGG